MQTTRPADVRYYEFLEALRADSRDGDNARWASYYRHQKKGTERARLIDAFGLTRIRLAYWTARQKARLDERAAERYHEQCLMPVARETVQMFVHVLPPEVAKWANNYVGMFCSKQLSFTAFKDLVLSIAGAEYATDHSDGESTWSPMHHRAIRRQLVEHSFSAVPSMDATVLRGRVRQVAGLYESERAKRQRQEAAGALSDMASDVPSAVQEEEGQ